MNPLCFYPVDFWIFLIITVFGVVLALPITGHGFKHEIISRSAFKSISQNPAVSLNATKCPGCCTSNPGDFKGVNQ